MTIAAAYLTSEGVAFGTDSTSTVKQADGSVLQLLDHAQKIFEVGERGRIGICSWGSGSIGPVSHRTLVAQLADQNGFAGYTVEQAAVAFQAIVTAARAAAQNTDLLGYFVGGWNLGSHEPRCYELVFNPGQNPTIDALEIGQARFRGVPNFFMRVFRGFDPELPERLKATLIAKFWGQPPDNFEGRFQEAFDEAAAPLVAVGFPDVPIREAIDFLYSYIHITVKAVKFRFGPPPCGGPIELAFITTDRPFRWALHKSFQTAMFEQEPNRE